jgi:hypothetical protein
MRVVAQLGTGRYELSFAEDAATLHVEAVTETTK